MECLEYGVAEFFEHTGLDIGVEFVCGKISRGHSDPSLSLSDPFTIQGHGNYVLSHTASDNSLYEFFHEHEYVSARTTS